MDPAEVHIRSDGDNDEFRRRLERSWVVGFVADISLVDGTEVSAVLIGISSSALILDRWDGVVRAPAGDPFTLEYAVVAEVSVL